MNLDNLMLGNLFSILYKIHCDGELNSIRMRRFAMGDIESALINTLLELHK